MTFEKGYGTRRQPPAFSSSLTFLQLRWPWCSWQDPGPGKCFRVNSNKYCALKSSPFMVNSWAMASSRSCAAVGFPPSKMLRAVKPQVGPTWINKILKIQELLAFQSSPVISWALSSIGSALAEHIDTRGWDSILSVPPGIPRPSCIRRWLYWPQQAVPLPQQVSPDWLSWEALVVVVGPQVKYATL